MQPTETILLSLGTSLIVCVITFVLGLKAGKNQTDRAKLQNIYKQLHNHFTGLKESLLADSPQSWEKYKKKMITQNSYKYIPYVMELKEDGDILFLKPKIVEKSLSLEEQILDYSSKLKHYIPELQNALISNLELYCDGYTFKKYRSDGDEKAHFETSNPQKCCTFSPQEYYVLYNKEKLIKLFNKFNESSCAIEFSLGNPIEYSFKIFPESLKVDIDKYLECIIANFQSAIYEYNELTTRKADLIKQIDSLDKKIKKRVREPISFWETIIGAFGDIFR